MPSANTEFKALPCNIDDDYDTAEEIKDGSHTSHRILVETEVGTAVVEIIVPGALDKLSDMVCDDIEAHLRKALTD